MTFSWVVVLQYYTKISPAQSTLSCSRQRTIAWWQPEDVSLYFLFLFRLNFSDKQQASTSYNRTAQFLLTGTAKTSLFFSVISPKDLSIKRSIAVNRQRRSDHFQICSGQSLQKHTYDIKNNFNICIFFSFSMTQFYKSLGPTKKKSRTKQIRGSLT